MRKIVCTATIFSATVALTVALIWILFFIHRAATVWWCKSLGADFQVPLVILVFLNVVVPIGMGIFVVGAALGLWHLSAKLCSKLRGGA